MAQVIMLRVTFLVLLAGLAIGCAALVIDGQRTHALQLFAWAVASAALGVVLLRSVAHALRRSPLCARRILIIGTGDEARRVAGDILHGFRRTLLVGHYEVGGCAWGVPATVFPNSQALQQVVHEQRVDEIVVAEREQHGGALPMDELLACRVRGVPVRSLADFYERAHGQVPVEGLPASWLVYGRGFVQGRLRRVVKRCFDIVASSLLLVAALPVMVLAALAIRLQGPGPILYRQERVGLGGRSFQCLKFRSMRIDAERDGVARWAARNDTRITPVGAFLRCSRIDELPQLLCVLAGAMSLVGPRPERPAFVEELRRSIPFYDLRHSVKPGLTGWAQVRHGYCASVDDARRKHQFDLYYVKNHSLLLDLLVLAETVSVVLLREGAR